MKKYAAVLLTAACLLFGGCSQTQGEVDQASQEVPADYGQVIELAKAEFEAVFAEFAELKIEQTATMVRADDSNQIVVQFTYSSANGDGVYGFEYRKDQNGTPELLHQGEAVDQEILLQ